MRRLVRKRRAVALTPELPELAASLDYPAHSAHGVAAQLREKAAPQPVEAPICRVLRIVEMAENRKKRARLQKRRHDLDKVGARHAAPSDGGLSYGQAGRLGNAEKALYVLRWWERHVFVGDPHVREARLEYGSKGRLRELPVEEAVLHAVFSVAHRPELHVASVPREPLVRPAVAVVVSEE
eukprot:3076221-Prymnesium_polylepis.1